jgi:hypothetical protein
MKKINLLFLMLTFVSVLFAQQTITYSNFSEKNDKVEKNDQIQTVMSSFELKRISGFGGPIVSYTSILDEFAVMSGGGGGVIINNFFFGGYGEGLSNYVKSGPNNEIRNIEFGHGGFWMGYEFFPEKMIHPVISLRTGWGTVGGIDQNNAKLIDGVFVMVPTMSAEINFTRFFKLNVGAEYRKVLNLNNMGSYTNSDFSNMGVYMSFIFGWF